MSEYGSDNLDNSFIRKTYYPTKNELKAIKILANGKNWTAVAEDLHLSKEDVDKMAYHLRIYAEARTFEHLMGIALKNKWLNFGDLNNYKDFYDDY